MSNASFSINSDPLSIEDGRIETWLRNTCEGYDDWEWNGEVLTVFNGDDVEKHTRADLVECGCLPKAA